MNNDWFDVSYWSLLTSSSSELSELSSEPAAAAATMSCNVRPNEYD